MQNVKELSFAPVSRKEFLTFLRRPDEKEEYVLQWQNHYNDLAEDMRSDDEVKAELHQEVDVS